MTPPNENGARPVEAEASASRLQCDASIISERSDAPSSGADARVIARHGPVTAPAGGPPFEPPLKAALAMASRGLRVFPGRDNGKEPRFAGWQAGATTDPAQIKKWLRQYPKANYIVVPDNHIVVDIDCKHSKPGFENAAKLGLPLTYTIETTTGGQHQYFKSDAPVDSGNNVYGDGVDIKSGTSGYVVGPGSVIDGKLYRCIQKGRIADAPACIKTRPAKPKDKDATREAIATDPDNAVTTAKLLLESFPPAIEGQGGDRHTLKAAMCVRDLGVPQERAAEAMAAWNEKCEPPWTPDDLDKKISNAYRYAKNPQGALSPEGLGFTLVEAPATETSVPNQSRRTLRSRDATLNSLRTPNYLVKGLLYKRSLAMLFGNYSAGKTFVLLSLCAHLAEGCTWFGFRVRQARVLYFTWEGDVGMEKRNVALYQKHSDFKSGFTIEFLNAPILTDGPGRAHVMSVIEEYTKQNGPPDLIVFDPLQDALGGNDSDPAFIEPYKKFIRKLRAETSACILTVHHTGHTNQDRARGHSSLPAAMDCVLWVDKSQKTISTTKARDDKLERFGFELEILTLGEDVDGDLIRSCVAIPRDLAAGVLPEKQRIMWDAARSVVNENGEFDRQDAIKKSGLPAGSASSAFTRLMDDRKAFIALNARGRYRIKNFGSAAAEFPPVEGSA
jgi:hypothetical protein